MHTNRGEKNEHKNIAKGGGGGEERKSEILVGIAK
jgi:hypothetical protein